MFGFSISLTWLVLDVDVTYKAIISEITTRIDAMICNSYVFKFSFSYFDISYSLKLIRRNKHPVIKNSILFISDIVNNVLLLTNVFFFSSDNF